MKLAFWRKDIVEAPKRNNSIINKKNLKNFIIKTVGLIAKQGENREGFTYPEYDLEEIRIASVSDSYIKQALSKYSYQIFKAGYNIKSENHKARDYINKRFRIMSFASQKPMDILFQEIADDLVKYSNAFLIKSRVDSIGMGIKARGVYADKPVGGYFRICPSTIRVKRNENGKIEKYQQFVNGKEKNYKTEDVIHMYLDKDPNNVFGTPRIIAALEDVKLLRKIEGNVISLIYRFAIPIYQWIIGLPEAGLMATDTEINDAKSEIEKIAMDGVIVTNERTQVKAVGAEGEALDASGYLSYFEKRVFTALSVSESQMGRGGSRQDADSMEAQVHDVVKYIEKTFSIFTENMIVNELLLEGGFNPIINEEDIVNFVFEEISLDTKVKVENHQMLKFQSNVSTLEETRRAMGKKEDVDENRLYANMIDNKNALSQIEAKTEGAMMIQRERPATGIAGNGKTPKVNDAKGKVKNNNMPKNQSGTTSVKIKESSENQEVILLNKKAEDKEKHKEIYRSVYSKYEELRNDICRDKECIDITVPIAKDSISKEIKKYVYLAVESGKIKALEDSDKGGDAQGLKINISELEKYVESKIKTLLTDIKNKLKTAKDIESVFDVMEYRIRYLIEYIIPKSYWYAYVKTNKELGVKELEIDFNGSDDEKNHKKEIDTSNFALEDIPAFHPFCDCEIRSKVVNKK